MVAPRSLPRSNPEEKLPSLQSKPLEDLIARWNSAKHQPAGTDDSIVEKLVSDSVEFLMCTDEMLELINFLNQEGLEDLRARVENELVERLRNRQDPGLRESLLNSSRNGQFKRSWFYYAGIGCPEEEFGTFSSALGNSAEAIHLKYGYYSKTASTDPRVAIEETLRVLPVGVLEENFEGAFPYDGPVDYSASILHELFEKAPAESDFAALERLLPPDRDNDSNPINRARKVAVSRWALQDARGAVDFVIHHPERVNPSALGGIASLENESLLPVLDYISGFEKSSRRDAVLAAIALSLDPGRGDVTGLFVGQISNPSVKGEVGQAIIQGQNSGRLR